MRAWKLAALLSTAAVILAAAPPAQRGAAVVAADHVLASDAGVEVLAAGGNAVDAAVAAALAAGVVQPAGSGLGGGGFAIVALGGAPTALDFREVAPAGATRDMYRTTDGGVHEWTSRTGGLAVAVPGEPLGLAELVRRWGKLSHAKVAAPAVRLAARGFPVGAHLAESLSRSKYDGVRALFAVGGSPARAGDTVRRPDLARTLSRWGSSRGRSLSEASGARAIAAAAGREGGVLTAADVAGYAPKERAPLVGRYKGYTITTMAPPSSGGVALLQMLAAVEPFDVAGMGLNSIDGIHLLTEVMKHAFADRAHHLGDPDFVQVPVERLLSAERIDEIRRKVWGGRTFPAEYYGALIAPPRDAGTQHISVVDRTGGGVALTTTINTSFGSGVIVPELGVLLNNEMDDFSAAPGVPNAYGLVGAEANAIAPGKRPLSSMTPTVVTDADGEVVIVVGASGGSTIISSVFQVILDVIEHGMDPQEAVASPRVHHQWQPDVLMVEPGIPVDVVRGLEARGHDVKVREAFSAVQIVAVDGEGVTGGSDPRKGGWPASTW